MPKPPNNPSKAPHSKSKRTRTTSPSGWTHITKGPTPHLPQRHTTALQQRQQQQQQQQHHQQQQSISLEPYTSRFETHYLPQWQSSSCWASLSLIFKSEINPSITPRNRITNCACLGLGSLTTTSGTNSSTQASWWQLAALVSIVELLLDTSSSPNSEDDEASKQQPFEIIFQDPIFTTADEEFLTEHLPSFFPLPIPKNNPNPSHDTQPSAPAPVPVPVKVKVEVVKDPEAFSRIGKETFLFAPHLEVGVFARALEKGGEGGPVVCIGSDVESYIDGLLSQHAESARPGSVDVFRRFRQGREEREMPGFERGNWCFALRVYWVDGRGKGEGEDEGVKEIVRGMEEQRL